MPSPGAGQSGLSTTLSDNHDHRLENFLIRQSTSRAIARGTDGRRIGQGREVVFFPSWIDFGHRRLAQRELIKR